MKIDEKKIKAAVDKRAADIQDELLQHVIDGLADKVAREQIKKFTPIVEEKLRKAIEAKLPQVVDRVVKEATSGINIELFY